MFRAVNGDKTCFATDGWIHAPLIIGDEACLPVLHLLTKTSDNLYACCSFKKLSFSRGAQILGPRWPWGLKFARWRLIFVGPQCGSCFNNPFGGPDVRGGI